MVESEALSIRAWQALPMDAFIWLLDEGTRMWRLELGDISEGTILWQPYHKGHSIGGILLHVAEEESFTFEELVTNQERPEATKELLKSHIATHRTGEWPDPQPWPLYRYYEIHNWVRANSVRSLREIGDPMIEFDHPYHGRLPLGLIILKLIQHEAYHAGQIMLHKLHHEMPIAA